MAIRSMGPLVGAGRGEVSTGHISGSRVDQSELANHASMSPRASKYPAGAGRGRGSWPSRSRPCPARCEATGGEALGGESRSESSSAAKIRSVAIEREDRSVYGPAESERARWASARTPASRGGAMDPGRVAGPAIRVFRGHRVLGALVLAIGLGPSAASAPTVGQLWLARYNGPADRADSAYALGVSPDGTRVYV